MKSSIMHSDVATRAQAVLDEALQTPPRVTPVGDLELVSKALKGPRIAGKSASSQHRVLVVSTKPVSAYSTLHALDGQVPLTTIFSEVHFLHLQYGRSQPVVVTRQASQVWSYDVRARHWMQLLRKALTVSSQELTFASGFRPDLVIATDAGESAVVAWWLRRRYGCKTQLQLSTEAATGLWVRNSFWYRWFRRALLKHFTSIGVTTKEAKTQVAKIVSKTDVQVFPVWHDYEASRNTVTPAALIATYQPLTFFIVCPTVLSVGSVAYQALDACRFALKNPHVGLVFFGTGLVVRELTARAKIFGFEKQVIFVAPQQPVEPYLAAASVVIEPSSELTADHYLWVAAALQRPVIASDTATRSDVFEDRVSAFLPAPGDITAFTAAVRDVINNLGLRRVIAQQGSAAVCSYFHQDIQAYHEAYRAVLIAPLSATDKNSMV